MDSHRCRRNSPDRKEMGFHFHPSVFQISTDESPYPFEVTPSRWHINFGEHCEYIHEARTITEFEICGPELKEEEQLLKDSLLRIMASAATVPQTLRVDVVDELENQL